MGPAVKICGLTDAAAVLVAAGAGARYLGFVFFPPSPRHLTLARGHALAAQAPPGIAKVGLVVDPDDAALDALLGAVPLDMLQLHGSESPDRVAEIRARTGLRVIKALGVAELADLDRAADYADVADMMLLDAKAPAGADRPGGHGAAFDWRLLAGYRPGRPWMLAGGLAPGNAAEAARLTGAPALDVSSGVESVPGVKDPALIRDFVEAASAADRAA